MMDYLSKGYRVGGLIPPNTLNQKNKRRLEIMFIKNYTETISRTYASKQIAKFKGTDFFEIELKELVTERFFNILMEEGFSSIKKLYPSSKGVVAVEYNSAPNIVRFRFANKEELNLGKGGEKSW